MSDIDSELQRRLKAFAEEVAPQVGRGAEVIRAARTRRRFAAVGAGLMAIVLIGGVAGAASLLADRDRIDPAPNPNTRRSFARYFFETGSRDASASGVLEVNSHERTLCYEATTENIQASHLLRNTGVVAGGRRFERMIVVTFFDPEVRQQRAELPSGGRICFDEEELGELEGGLQVLIDHPEDFRVDFHRGPNDDPGLVAELQAEPRVTTERCDFPTTRPTYLPWLAEGDRPGAPILSYEEEIERAQLSWRHRSGADVSLTVYPEDLDSTGEPIGVEVDGVEGHLHRGEGGTMSVSWDLKARCDLLELGLSLPGASQKALKTELLKIARSLTTANKGTADPKV